MNEFDVFDDHLDIPPETQLFLDEVRDNEYGLRFSFSEPSSELRVNVTFSTYLMYRVANESYRLRRSKQAESGSFLMKAKRSDFIHWFHEESCGQCLDTSVLHFLISSSDDIIDVLSYEPPSVEKVGP